MTIDLPEDLFVSAFRCLAVVAVFGSLLASQFTSSMTDKLGGVLPADLFAQVKDNVGQAVGIAHQTDAAKPFAGQIVNAANDSFLGGLHLVGVVGAGITFLAAIGVVLFLPARARDEEPVVVLDEDAPAVVAATAG